MKKLSLVGIICFAIAACGGDKQTTETKNAVDTNAQFEKYKEDFIEGLWRVYPGWASSQGYHKYDWVLIVPDSKARSKEFSFAKRQLDSLKYFDINTLSDNNKTDYYIIENQLNATTWSINELKSFEWNPSEYNVSGSFAEILIGNYDSLDVRLRNFYKKMKAVPAYYEAAKVNIKNPTVEHTQLAIDQNLGGISVFEKELKDALAKVNFSDEEKKEIETRAKETVEAIKGYVEWLKKLENKNPRSFRLGKDLYAKKFEYDIQSAYTAEQMFKKAITHKEELHEKMFEIADTLWYKYIGNPIIWGQRGPMPKPKDSLQLIKMVIDAISLKHAKPEEFQSAIEKQIPELTAFVKEKNLLYMDPSKPLVVRKEPDYMAGVAGASISAPGPYDKNGNTYYNVGTLSGMSKEEKESYLREYNYYILQILNIHEAVPGHYAQLIYSNQSPSLIKSILGNGTMVEGWAVYSERMMLENGYGNNDPEMWLMYYKWNLRATCNTILDVSVHTKDMTKEAALKLLIDEAFQQKAEAEGKWRRVTLSQVQLCSYYTGYTEIYEFREELKQQLGDKFNLKEFHEKFLSYGSTPIKYIKELMQKELSQNKAK